MSTFPITTGTGSNIIGPHETNTQASPAPSDVFARLECELNKLQSAIQTHKECVAALTMFDQDIDAAKRRILSMLTRRNMVVPISILPEEILARIFHFRAFSEQPYSLGWIPVTHVCRHWRQIALDDSTLWTHFSSSPRNKEWIFERLSRSRNAPLVIELDGWTGKGTVPLFTPHLSHTRKLCVRKLSSLSLRSEIIQEIGIWKAPVLDHLELSATRYLEPAFNGPLPKLRIFCISQIVLHWSLIPRGQLTELKISFMEEMPTLSSKVFQHDGDLIGLLVDCPLLEILTLENCLPSMLSESSGGQTIHLPRLSHLCLAGSSSRVAKLLKILKISSSTTLHLKCTSTTHNDDHILPILSEHFNDPTLVKFRSFKINLKDVDRVIDMVASTSLPISPVSQTHVIPADSGAELSLSFHRVVELNNGMDILRRACNVLCLSNLYLLSISFPIPNQSINWKEIFEQCTEVTTVQVCGHGTIGLLQALTPPKRAKKTARRKGRKRKRGDNGSGAGAQAPDDDGPAPMHVPIFPKLTSLLLEMLDFTDEVTGSVVVYDLVMSAVQRRKANKMPLTALWIENCTIREEQANALEKVVRDFRWDHEEGYFDDDFGGVAMA